MKVYRLKEFSLGGLQQIEEPEPHAPVGRQVLVRLRASSLNARDWRSTNGTIATVTKPGGIPLCDGAGEVITLGPDVTRVRPGDRVAVNYHWNWIGGPIPDEFNLYGRNVHPDDGMLTELRLLDESELVRLPEHLSFEEGATLPCAALTAWSALHGDQPLLPGEDVLVQGTGGVSVFALQIAKLSGARVIALTLTPEKTDALKALGADVVIDASSGPGWHKDVLEATRGRGVDVTVDVLGYTRWDDSVAATRENGRISMVGAIGGRGGGLSDHFMMRGLHLHPTRVGSRVRFEQMNRALALHGVRPVIDRAFDFDDARSAFQYFEQHGRLGKVVIRHG